MQKNVIIFDTETISLNKSFIYNIGYVICDPDGKVLLQRDMVIRQIYDNAPLFATAYYAALHRKNEGQTDGQGLLGQGLSNHGERHQDLRGDRRIRLQRGL